MVRSLFLIPAILSSVACSQPDEYREQAGVSPSDPATASPTDAATQPVSIEEETDRYSFAYSWPKEASAYPGLAEELQARAGRMKTNLEEEADRDFAAAAGEDWQARPHSASMDWKVVADLPDWLSLSGEMDSYSGGAHGIHGKRSLIWDKRNERAMEGVELFASPMALERALGEKLCAALDAERAQRRGEPVDPDADDPFNDCPAVDEATVLVGSSNGRTFDRIGIYFGPYVAGAYAEGDFELDFPVTGSVLDAVNPDYAQAFSVHR